MKNLRLFIKTIIIFFTICILIVLSFILIKLANRYIVVNKFSNNLVSKYLEKNNTYNFSKDVFNWSPTENKFYSEITYCKDNVLKKEYYKADFSEDNDKKYNNILERKKYQSYFEINDCNIKKIGIKYKDSENYYVINPVDKIYNEASNTQNPELLYNSDVSSIDSIINEELNSMTSFWEKLSIVLNKDYDIYKTPNFYHIRKKTEDKEIYLTTSMNNDNFVLAAEVLIKGKAKRDYTKIYLSLNNEKDVIENNIKLEDLSNYNRIYNYEVTF